MKPQKKSDFRVIKDEIKAAIPRPPRPAPRRTCPMCGEKDYSENVTTSKFGWVEGYCTHCSYEIRYPKNPRSKGGDSDWQCFQDLDLDSDEFDEVEEAV